MLAIGSDHAGFDLKQKLISLFDDLNIEYKDYGTYTADSCDYPVIAHKVGQAVSSGQADKGVLVCGSGIGVSIAANKIRGVRAALCYEPELAALARKHNDANVVCLGSRFTDFETAKKIIDVFLHTDFENGRHLRRVEQIEKVEKSV